MQLDENKQALLRLLAGDGAATPKAGGAAAPEGAAPAASVRRDAVSAEAATLELDAGSGQQADGDSRSTSPGDRKKAGRLLSLCRGYKVELGQLLDTLKAAGVDVATLQQEATALDTRLQALEQLRGSVVNPDPAVSDPAMAKFLQDGESLRVAYLATLDKARKARHDQQSAAVVKGIADNTLDAGLRKELGELHELNGKLEALGFAGLVPTANEADFLDAIKRAGALADPAERTKALGAVNRRLGEAIEHQKALLALGEKAAKDSKSGALDDNGRSEVYRKALEQQYGIKIKVPSPSRSPGGKTQTHFDRVYDVLGSVPKSQAKNPKFKTLEYDNSPGGGAAYGDTVISLGDMDDASSSTPYQVDGKPVQANWMNVAMLHELGHSLDDDKSIMKGQMADEGCGGWKAESLDSVTNALVTSLQGQVSDNPDVHELRKLVHKTLAAGAGPVPADATPFSAGDWPKITAFLANTVLAILQKANPWFKPAPPFVAGGRAYHQAYDNEWWSYSMAARGSTFVRDYQWRSPWEWFAEVYAITWYAKSKPPAGVSGKLAPYLWKP